MYDIILIDASGWAHATIAYNSIDPETALLQNFQTLSKTYPEAAVIVLWDHPEAKEVRRKLFPAYKTRERSPEVSELLRSCAAVTMQAGYAVWLDPEYEADDLIATICQTYTDKKILIYGRDKDMFALLTDNISQLTANIADPKSEKIPMTPRLVREKYGVLCDQWYDLSALAGDSSDTIPGVSQIGQGTAVPLLQKFGSIDTLVMQIDNVVLPPRRKKNLVAAIADGSLELYRSIIRPRIARTIPPHIANEIEKYDKHLQFSNSNTTEETETPMVADIAVGKSLFDVLDEDEDVTDPFVPNEFGVIPPQTGASTFTDDLAPWEEETKVIESIQLPDALSDLLMDEDD